MSVKNEKIVELSHTTRFTHKQLEEAAIEYGAHFLDIFAHEASRTGKDLLTLVKQLSLIPQ